MISNQDSFEAFDKLIAEAPEAPSELTAVPSQGIAAISSLDIANITGKNHADVMRDIRSTLEQAEIGLSKFASSYRNAQNKEQPCYLLPRRECDLVVSGYSVKYRLAIIDRWQELEAKEAKQSFAMPRNLPEALRLAADLAEKNAEQAAHLAIATPKAEALDRLSLADGTSCITNAAKLLQVQPKALFKFLREQCWIYRRGAEWTAYQNRLQQGYLDQKVTTVDRADGSQKICQQVLVTAKGLTRLATLLQK